MTTVDTRRTVHALRALACRLEAGDVYVSDTNRVYVYMIDAPRIGIAALLAAIPDPVIEVHATDRTRCTISGPLLTMHVYLELRVPQALEHLPVPTGAAS